MNNGNTINPGQLSNMADQTNDNDFSNLDLDTFDPETFNPEASDLGTFDPETFGLNGFDANGFYDMNHDTSLTELFNGNGGFPNTSFNEPQEPVSSQQSYNTSHFAPTFDQAAPNLAPPLGQLYHPEIGWYYPVQAPGPIFTQQPMSTFTPYSAPPVVENTPTPEPTRPSTGKNKRKYGPGVYGEQQAKRRAVGGDSGPRPVSRESVDYHVPAARKIKPMKGTASKKKKGSKKGGKSKDPFKPPRTCRCEAFKAAKRAHIPRPTNSFMLFRSDFGSNRVLAEGEKRGNGNAHTSTTAAAAWTVLKEKNDKTYLKYVEMGFDEERKHKEAHPNYKFDPKIMYRAKFGRPDCACGAYATNSAAQRAYNAANGLNEDEVEEVVDDEDDAYVMPTTRSMSRSNSLAPAPVDQTFDFTFDYNLDVGSGNMPNLGYQNESAESQYNAQLNHVNAADDTYVPPVTRRSTRIGQKAVSYIEETVVKEEDLDGDVEMTDSAPRKKRRPSPIAISSNASPKMSDFVDISPEGPASRTRSKSGSFDENQFREASPSDSLFGDYSEDVGENITLATPMTGISNVSPKNRSGLDLPASQARATRSQSRGSR
jgi:hypothetical protein